MVARDVPPSDPFEQVMAILSAVAEAFFSAWRGLLEATYRVARIIYNAIVAGGVRWMSQWVMVREYFADPLGPWTRVDVPSVAAAFGLRAFAFGALASAALLMARGGTARAAVAMVVVESAWAAGRFAICAALIPASLAPRHRLVAVYLAGLAPYALGLTGALRLLALGASALLTARGVHGAGVGDRSVRIAIAWGFGGQIGVIVLGIASRAALAVLAGA